MSCQDLKGDESGFRIPNCDDPVFMAWCKACGLLTGEKYAWHDARMQQLQVIMDDPRYDPEQDTADDYLTRGI